MSSAQAETIADLLERGEIDDDLIDREALAQWERPPPTKLIPRLMCSRCRCFVGPGYGEMEIFYALDTKEWVCGWHYRRDLATIDNFIKLASEDEVCRLSGPQLHRLLRERTERIEQEDQ